MINIAFHGDQMFVNGVAFRACAWRGRNWAEDPQEVVLRFHRLYLEGKSLSALRPLTGVAYPAMTKMAKAIGIGRTRGGRQASHKKERGDNM